MEITKSAEIYKNNILWYSANYKGIKYMLILNGLEKYKLKIDGYSTSHEFKPPLTIRQARQIFLFDFMLKNNTVSDASCAIFVPSVKRKRKVPYAIGMDIFNMNYPKFMSAFNEMLINYYPGS